METRISMVTLGVDDVARSAAFYAELGWHGHTVEETVFIDAHGIVLTLWSRAKLAADCGVEDTIVAAGSPRTFGGIALAHNVRDTAEVDRILAAARGAGAEITREASTTFYGGYAGVFADPDGHCWEIAHNPGFEFADDGSIVLPF